MTEWDMRKEEGGEHFETLCEWICKIVIRDSQKTFIPVDKPHIAQIWGNVYKQGHHTQEHRHLPNIWSFVYFVNVSSECSPLVFPDAEFSTAPRNGLLVLFPSWLRHFVPAQTVNYDRISIAGNIIPLIS